MDIDTAPRPEDPDEDRECGVCDAEESFVLYDNDKVCRNCGYVPGNGGTNGYNDNVFDQWSEWQEHRRENEDYSGWYGEDRIKFVGGFLTPYVADDE